MKLFLPKQHGAWAMLIIPFWLSAAAAGVRFEHIPFFFGWLLLYLATYPMLLLFKKKKVNFYIEWTLIYLVPALILLMAPLWARPSLFFFGLLMLPLFFVNIYFSGKNQDRALLNDFSAIFVFAIAGLASGYLSAGMISEDLVLIFIASVLFFVGSTFYVKTMIREKKSLLYKRISWTYHIIVPIVWLVLGEWLAAVAFLPSLMRAFAFYGKPYSIKKVGILEIANSAFFFTVMLIAVI
ncbi:hypothetical protein CU633_03420 [Bacillus sp. V3-13]|uniref:YwiC-like family protein n=1 Tax=Bacillus sp. V3-13 TaxID=2053728 RepID=UPI000C76E3E1|nr:YwiC-like family protein [Bacillus sp. V3-13]PLR78855.1 hypothetical protein CU633_03420 [Bacillus sp. V3-13]